MRPRSLLVISLISTAWCGLSACASKPKPAPAPANSPEAVAATPAPAAAPAPPARSSVPAPATEVAPPPAPAAPSPYEAATPSTPPAPTPYDEILRLKQAGVSDQLILSKIRTDNITYNLTTDQILRLRSAGLSEEILEAMIKSGRASGTTAGTPTARKAEFTLALVDKAFLGVLGTSTKHVGRLTIEGDKLTWIGQDPEKNRNLFVQNIKQIYNTCVLRAGGNQCLEFGLITYTGEEFRLRDPGWERGENQGVVGLTEYFRTHLPNVPFAEKITDKI